MPKSFRDHKNVPRETVDYRMSTEIFFDYIEGSPHFMLWDAYGFFTHLYAEAWQLEVIAHMPPGCDDWQELRPYMDEFMRKRAQLYCCMN